MDKRSFSDISPDEINKEEEEYESESDINNVNHAIKRFKLGEENFMERKVEQVFFFFFCFFEELNQTIDFDTGEYIRFPPIINTIFFKTQIRRRKLQRRRGRRGR